MPDNDSHPTLAGHIIIDRARRTLTVDGEPLPWDITPDVTMTRNGPYDQVTVTIIGLIVTVDARGLLVIDDRYLPWLIGAAGPRIALNAPGGVRLLITIDILARHVEEIPAEEASDA